MSKALENKVIIKRRFAYEKLVEKEQNVLSKAAALIAAAYSKFNLERVQIVEFESLTGAVYLGMHEPDGTILLARSQLENIKFCLKTLIHECAHDKSDEDLSFAHTTALEDLWADVMELYLEPVG